MRFIILVIASWLVGSDPSGHEEPPWGSVGHQFATVAAVTTLPGDMPRFFREAGAQLAYLNPEPDRWRSRTRVEMDQAWAYDHYIDLENVPDRALAAQHRFAYLELLYESGLARPERDGGFLPYRILELYQRLVTEWEMWREEGDPTRRLWIEARILNDAGVLGHYVTDASQPHHTTIHFNGWARGVPNPGGYPDDPPFHSRFESDFIEAHVSQDDVTERVPGAPRSVAGFARRAILDHIYASHAQVDALYRLDRDIGFDPSGPTEIATRDFAAERLADGASMLAVLWWSAWLEAS